MSQKGSKTTTYGLTGTRILFLFILASFIFALIYVPLRTLIDESYREATEYKIIIFQLAMGVVFLRLPNFISRIFCIRISGGLTVSYMLFLWLSLFLGEFALFYYRIPVWDSLLHLFSAALMTVAALSLTRLSASPEPPQPHSTKPLYPCSSEHKPHHSSEQLSCHLPKHPHHSSEQLSCHPQKHPHHSSEPLIRQPSEATDHSSYEDVAHLGLKTFSTPLHPLICALLAVGASITVGVLWEIYEFTFDGILGLNMQKFAAPSGINAGGDSDFGFGALLPIGSGTGRLSALVGRDALVDTMTDLILDVAASVTVGIWGYIYINRKGELPRSVRISRTSADKASTIF